LVGNKVGCKQRAKKYEHYNTAQIVDPLSDAELSLVCDLSG